MDNVNEMLATLNTLENRIDTKTDTKIKTAIVESENATVKTLDVFMGAHNDLVYTCRARFKAQSGINWFAITGLVALCLGVIGVAAYEYEETKELRDRIEKLENNR